MPNKTLNFSDDAYDFLMKYEGNKSEFVSDLITGNIENNALPKLDNLLNKEREIKKNIEILNVELGDIQKQIQELQSKEKAYERDRKLKEKLFKFNLEGEELKRDWVNGLIDDDEYWKKVDQRKKQREEMENEIE